MIILVQIEELIAKCRTLTEEDNWRVQNHWIVEGKKGGIGGNYLSVIKGLKSHFVLNQNGNIVSGSSSRRRVGLWDQGVRHVSSLKVISGGKDTRSIFLKYVRSFGYVYRRYEGLERIDYIPPSRGAYVIYLHSENELSVDFSIDILHELSWPVSEKAGTYRETTGENSCEIKSEIASTRITVDSPGKAEFRVNGRNVNVRISGCKSAFLHISCDGSSPVADELEKTLEYHTSINAYSILETPSFEMNKLFQWAKHDLLELFTDTPEGSGWYAGMPKFSWFFGRDGEWMSFAASECGMDDLSRKHLDMLYTHSRNGRIPHEIPIIDKNSIPNYTYVLDKTPVNTRFMSIDSSPLWVMAALQLSRWTGEKVDMTALEKVMSFISTCDRDGDGLIENRFREGLIGWPESWAENRDGICIDVNGWWLEAQRLYAEYTGKEPVNYQKGVKRFNSLFLEHIEGGIRAYDSVLDGTKKEIKSSMLIIPAMYSSTPDIKLLLRSLDREDMVTPWGVRSVSTEDPMYDSGYHTGMIWPLMTGWMALALFRNGMGESAFKSLSTFPLLAFSSPDPGRINETYNSEYLNPQGQFFQGWSSSLFIQGVMEGLFGIPFMPNSDSLREVMKPYMPAGWNNFKMKRLKYRGIVYDIEVTGNDVRITKSL